MLLDDLVSVIDTLKTRIASHGAVLRENETRTRMALIDPLLTALGWDAANPEIVRPEFHVGASGNSGRVDYGLLGSNGQLVASIEAKRLGESLENHEKQLFDYAYNLKVRYAGLTDGNRWYFLDSTKVTSSDPLILEVVLTSAPAYETALNLLLLWKPNLASGQPVPANSPAFVNPFPDKTAIVPNPPHPSPDPVPAGKWTRLSQIDKVAGSKPPKAIRFNSQSPRQAEVWWKVLVEVAEWLNQTGSLTANTLPIKGMGFVNTSPYGPTGKPFYLHKPIAGGIHLNIKLGADDIVKNSKRLLQHFGTSSDSVELLLE